MEYLPGVTEHLSIFSPLDADKLPSWGGDNSAGQSGSLSRSHFHQSWAYALYTEPEWNYREAKPVHRDLVLLSQSHIKRHEKYVEVRLFTSAETVNHHVPVIFRSPRKWTISGKWGRWWSLCSNTKTKAHTVWLLTNNPTQHLHDATLTRHCINTEWLLKISMVWHNLWHQSFTPNFLHVHVID